MTINEPRRRREYKAVFENGRWLVVTEGIRGRSVVGLYPAGDGELAREWAEWFNDPTRGSDDMPNQPHAPPPPRPL